MVNNRNKGISNGKLGGRSSDTYDFLRNIVKKRILTLLELYIKVKIPLATRIYSIVLMIVMLTHI